MSIFVFNRWFEFRSYSWWCSLIKQVRVTTRRTIMRSSGWCFDSLNGGYYQSHVMSFLVLSPLCEVAWLKQCLSPRFSKCQSLLQTLVTHTIRLHDQPFKLFDPAEEGLGFKLNTLAVNETKKKLEAYFFIYCLGLMMKVFCTYTLCLWKKKKLKKDFMAHSLQTKLSMSCVK